MTASDAALLATLAGLLVPLLVGIVTKTTAPAGLKAMINAALSALGGLVATVVPGAFHWHPFLASWATAWVVSIATYYGLWKPTGVAPAIHQSTGTVGVG
jgi:small basic protein